jgi:aspartyl-tRNA(Asn)/glutamyl-tRNA(Gln) amidotransferase subunit A
VPIAAPAIGQRALQNERGGTNSQQAVLTMTSPWSLLGFPAMSIPVGNAVGGRTLPRSVQLIAKPGQEWQLLRVALALEASLRTG